MGIIARHLARRQARRCRVVPAASFARESLPTFDPALSLWMAESVIVGGDPSLILAATDLFLDESSDYADLSGAIRRFLRWRIESEPVFRDLDYAMCLGAPWSGNYWHWMMERLPKVLLAESAGFDGVYLVPPTTFATASLQRLGIAPDRILPLGDTLWRVKRLAVAPKLEGKKFGAHPELLRRLHATLGPSVTPRRARRLYLTRNCGPATRRLVNEAAFTAVIQRFGFEELAPETMTLEHQILHFSEAEAVIGPHGAAFTNIMFMPEKSLILEMFAPSYIQPVMLPAIRLLGHRYHQILPHLPDSNLLYPHGDGIEAPLDLIETILANNLEYTH